MGVEGISEGRGIGAKEERFAVRQAAVLTGSTCNATVIRSRAAKRLDDKVVQLRTGLCMSNYSEPITCH